MRILDTGPETLVGRPEYEGTDAHGNQITRPWRPGDPTVLIERAQVAPSRDQPELVEGQRQDVVYVVIFRRLPDDAPSLRSAEILWDGRSFEVLTGPEKRTRGRHTKHVTLTMRERR